MDELKKRISSSGAFRSFLKERDAAVIFRNYGWEAQHGVYYQDVDSGKHREVDVLASQIWTKKTKSGTQYARLRVPVEVKTMKDFHIIVSPTTGAEWASSYRNNICLADPGNEYVRLRKDLQASGLPQGAVDSLIAGMHEFAWPKERARLYSLMLTPPNELVFTSFRETNIGGEKELENSVFWRASQNLNSAVKSIAESIYQYHISWILAARGNEKFKGNNYIDETFDWMCTQVQFVDIIHPVVVTDASLWSIEKNAPKEIGWARFGLHGYNSSPEWWCDLVNSNHLESYVELLSNHYTSALKKTKAKINSKQCNAPRG